MKSFKARFCYLLACVFKCNCTKASSFFILNDRITNNFRLDHKYFIIKFKILGVFIFIAFKELKEKS